MIYRDSELIERCHECPQASTSRCTRCTKFFCAGHLFADEGVCESCESDYLKRPQTAGLGMVRGPVVAMLVVAAFLVMGLVGAALVLVPTVAACIKLDGRAERARRRAYLAELRPQRQLPAGG